VSKNVFDTAAWYLLSYSNTLSFSEWRETVKQTYVDLEKRYGAASAIDNLSKMVAYYCMEVAPGATGRRASSHFRKVHQWADFRDADTWWLEEWKSRRQFDTGVAELRLQCSSVPSLTPENVHNDHWGREALRVVLAEAQRRIEWDKRSSLGNLETIEQCARVSISVWGGWVVWDLYNREILKQRDRIPSLQSMYFLDRVIVEEYGENLPNLKMKEYL
jgi:hypothetical protein